MLLYILLVILVALLVFDYLLRNYTKNWRMLSEIPGPTPLPIIGNIIEFKDKSQRGMWVTFRRLSDSYYPILKGWTFNLAFVSVRHPDDLETILSHPKATCKEFPYKYIRSWLNNGLFSKKGDTLKYRRRMLTPAFHFNMLRGYMDIINKESERFMIDLGNKGKEFVEDVLPLFGDVTLNIIIESATGVEVDKNNKQIAMQYKHDIEEIGHICIYRMMHPYIPSCLLKFFDIGRREKKAVKSLHDLTNKIIQDRKEYHRANSTNLQGYKEFTENLEAESENVYTIGYKRKLRMLDILLAAEKDGLITEEGVREEVDTFLFGGSDTTRMVMAYFTMLMAEHKDIQDKVRAEVIPILEESGGQTGMAELHEMTYLEQCIKEAMRIYPIGSSVFRETTDYIKLKNYTIPPKVTVVCNIIDAHRDPNFWEEPLKFDPDRFTPERSRNRHPFAYIPFCAGPRNCIGQKFGWLEMKAVCSRLIYNFYLEPVDRTSDMVFIGDIILRPQDPFHVKFVKINRE